MVGVPGRRLRRGSIARSSSSHCDTASCVTGTTRQRDDGTITTSHRPVDSRTSRRLRWLQDLDAGVAGEVPRSERKEFSINRMFFRRFYAILRLGWDRVCTILLLTIFGLCIFQQYVQVHIFNELISTLSTNAIMYVYAEHYGNMPVGELPDVGGIFPPTMHTSLCGVGASVGEDVCGKVFHLAKEGSWGTGTDNVKHACTAAITGGDCEKVVGQLSWGMATGWWTFVWIAVWITVTPTFLSLSEYVQARLRCNISLELHSKVLRKRQLYRLVGLETDVDNYDQRVTEDLEYLLQMGVGVCIGNYRNYMPIQMQVWAFLWGLYYSGKELHKVASNELIASFFISAFLISVSIILVYSYLMGKVSKIQFNQKWYEGDLRWIHNRGVVHSESISLYNGEGKIEMRADGSFANVYSNYLRLAAYGSTLMGLAALFTAASPAYAILYMHEANVGSMDSLKVNGYFTSIIAGTGGVGGAIGVMMAYQQLALSGGPVHRLGVIVDKLRAYRPEDVADAFGGVAGSVVSSSDDAPIVFEGVSARAPWAADYLFHSLSFTLRKGERLCVMGPTGSGKSAVLRIVAGVWPPIRGKVARPEQTGRGGSFFIPQQAYVFTATLRELVLYPTRYDADGEAGSDEEARSVTKALERAELGDLLASWGLDAEVAWPDVLSGGERQRVAFARLLYQRPAVAVIDQATSALDVGLEARMYGALKEEGTTVLSVVDRRSAVGWHDRLLRFDDAGGWRVDPVDKEVRAAAEEEARLARQHGMVPDDNPARPRTAEPPTEGVSRAFWKRLFFMLRVTFPTWTCPAIIYFYISCITAGIMGAFTICGCRWGGELLMGQILNDGGKLIPLGDKWWWKFGGMWLIAVAGAFVQGLCTWAGARCSLYFRAAVQNELHLRYFQPKVMYATNNVDPGIDTVDQRLVQDHAYMVDFTQMFLFGGNVAAATGAIPGVFPGFCTAVVCISYCFTLTWFGALFGFIFLALGAVLTAFASPFFARASLAMARAEGKYRSMQAGVRGSAEAVNFYHGEGYEAKRADSLVHQHLYRAKMMVVRGGLALCITNNFCGILATVGPPVGLSIAAFYIKSGAPAAEDYTTALAFTLTSGLTLFRFIGSMSALGFLAGLVNRVGQLLDACERQGKYDADLRRFVRCTDGPSSDAVEVENLTLTTPDGSKLLFKDLSFQVTRGQSLLVMGRSGCGKSSLLRAIGGLWRPGHGSVIRRPGKVGTGGYLFLPQCSFTTEGSLAEQVLFPAAARKGAVPAQVMSELLEFVGLRDLLHKYGVEEPQAWDSILSLGQIQRIGFARALFHRPAFLIMDESTSSIDPDTESRLMGRVAALGITCLTVAHRASMLQYHKQLLRFDGQGGFEISRVDRT